MQSGFTHLHRAKPLERESGRECGRMGRDDGDVGTIGWKKRGVVMGRNGVRDGDGWMGKGDGARLEWQAQPQADQRGLPTLNNHRVGKTEMATEAKDTKTCVPTYMFTILLRKKNVTYVLADTSICTARLRD